jgi:AcrR family transcriptional regulator
MVQAAKPGKRLKARDRRESILAAAQGLFAEVGLHGAPVDDIARAAGISPAILYRHFPSKEALYDAVLDRISCRRESYIQAIVDSSSEFPDVLRLMTAAYVESVATEPDYLRMEMHSLLEGNRATAQFFENRWRPLTEYIEVELADEMEQGTLKVADVRSAALMFQGMIREALVQKLIYQDRRYQDLPLERLVETLIGMFLTAIGWPPERP